jgi:hypothetical protein
METTSMRILFSMAIVLFVTTAALAQAHDNQSKDDKVHKEIQQLFTDLNAAITKKDRAALENLYADEFQFIRPSGAVATKASHIDGIMSNDPLLSMPVPAPAIERLMVYGDVVISRGTVRGTAVSSIFVKKNGRWQLFQAQGTRLAPERNPVKLNPQLLDSFVGRYEFGPGAVATVTKEGDALRWRGGNRMPVTLVPLSETLFFAKESETEISFVKNDKGQVTDAVLRLGSCQDSKARKIE